MSTTLFTMVGGLKLSSKQPSQQPNWAFNVDAKKGHAFGILTALFGALRPSGSGAS